MCIRDRHNSWQQYIQFFEQSVTENYNTVIGYTPMELDSEKQPSRFLDSHIKCVNTANLTVPMHTKRSQANELSNSTLRTGYKSFKFEY